PKSTLADPTTSPVSLMPFAVIPAPLLSAPVATAAVDATAEAVALTAVPPLLTGPIATDIWPRAAKLERAVVKPDRTGTSPARLGPTAFTASATLRSSTMYDWAAKSVAAFSRSGPRKNGIT